MNPNTIQLIITTSAGVGVASLFAYFGWLGITVNTMSKDIVEIKTDIKHMNHRVESVEERLQLGFFNKDFSNTQVASDF